MPESIAMSTLSWLKPFATVRHLIRLRSNSLSETKSMLQIYIDGLRQLQRYALIQ